MTTDPTYPTSDECNFALLRKAGRRVAAIYDRHLAGIGITGAQYTLLAEIDGRRRAPPALGSLAEVLVMDRTSLSHTLKPLVRDGLVEVWADPDDGRSRLIGLTDRGRETLASARVEWANAQAAFEGLVGETTAAALRDLLRLTTRATQVY